MSANDQPSILTVCVPGSSSGITMDYGAMDLKQILAARERAAASHRSCDAGSSAGGERSASCDACDDSACGVDAVDGGSQTLIDRLSSVDELNSDHDGLSDAAINAIVSESGCTPSFFHADSGKKALELLRMLRFDLLVTGDRLPDMPVGQLIRRVRAAWPWQKWAMVGSNVSTQDEISARSLGAVGVFDAPPDWDVLSSLAAIAAGKSASIPSLNRVERESLVSSVVSSQSLSLNDASALPVSASSRTGGKGGHARRTAVIERRTVERRTIEPRTSNRSAG